MWNEETKQLVSEGKLVVLGVIQEQHAERCQLYRQWKEYEFPIVQDAFTGLGLAVVPVPILIDEYGVVISKRPRPHAISELVNQPSSPPDTIGLKLDPAQVTVEWLAKEFASHPALETLCALGDANLHSGSVESSREAIRCYQEALAMSDVDSSEGGSLRGALCFRLGVAYRMLFDGMEGDSQDPADFSSAGDHWAKALSENPNQYIWRRRIQQYGPRQIKPYPFYDWVEQAQQEITDRGEVPVRLTVPLTGSEIAQPSRAFSVAAQAVSHPDPEGKVTRDDGGLVRIHSTVVPPSVAPGKTVRIHVRFDPEKSEWNNEVDDLVVWINESPWGTLSQTRLTHPLVKEASSSEPRTIEFEFKTSDDITTGATISGFVLYYVCESDGSQCLYRRQDFSIPILITP